MYSPVKFKCCDALAVSTELIKDKDSTKFWGSYFDEEDGTVTFWDHIIKTHAQICVPDMSVFANKDITFKYVSFKASGDGNGKGYYPQ